MTAIAVHYKRKKAAQLSLSFDEPNPTSFSLGILKVKIHEVEDNLLADLVYYLTSFPAGKVFILLESLAPGARDKQRITYEDLVTILQAFPEGWTYQATNPPMPGEASNPEDRLHEKSGVMIY